MNFLEFFHQMFLNSYLCSHVCRQCHQSSSAAISEWLPKQWCSIVKKVREKKNYFLRGDFRQFSYKNVHIWDHFFPLLFPKDSEFLKILDIRLREVGAKRPLNGTSKVNTHTDRQTDGHTHRRTFRLIESIGPEGRCFENAAQWWSRC